MLQNIKFNVLTISTVEDVLRKIRWMEGHAQTHVVFATCLHHLTQLTIAGILKVFSKLIRPFFIVSMSMIQKRSYFCYIIECIFATAMVLGAHKDRGVRFYLTWCLEFKNGIFQVQSQVKSRYHYAEICVFCVTDFKFWLEPGFYLGLYLKYAVFEF